MLALYRSGRQTEALRGFERSRSYLADEIGIAPSKELGELEQRILEQDPDLDLPAAPSVTQRAVLVVEVAGGDASARMAESERQAITEALALIDETIERKGGEASTQRGSAVYASFAKVDEAVVAIEDVMATVGKSGIVPRASIDYGDIELHDSGEVAGPPVRRGAGLVAAAHPGQVLLSAEANQALSATGASGSLVRSLGTHRVHGVEASQPIFQVVLAGRDVEFPPLQLDTNPPPLPADRRAVAGYELREPTISDIAGTTYRAYQPSAGREVEMTVIDPVWAGEPGFVSRFEVETQHIGRLQHPHVLPLLDHWRDPGGAYLVMMWLDGGTLSERLARGRLDLEQGRRLLTQLGSALSYAHQEGIVHGAISPGAVTLDVSGNGYVSTSRLVVRLTGAPLAQSRYLAPEYAAGEPLTPATDVYGMGRLAEDIIGAEGTLGKVIERATSDLPADRYPSIDEFLSAVGGAIGLEVLEPAVAPMRNPYKGLAAFQEADTEDFFGRYEAVSELVGLLTDRKLVAVIGPSGSGKSSLIHAGLIPAVRAGALDGASNWAVANMFPGSYPLEELESALNRVAVEDPGALIDELENDDRGLSRVIKRILPAETRLLLVIDQFEELFTLTHDEVARNRLLSSLVSLANDERSDTRVVLTLRADFFDRPLQYAEFGELLKQGIVPLTVPTNDELIDAIKRPAEVVGASWEPGLTEQILSDVSGSPGTLPLLQYALTELFAARTGHQLTHQVYLQNGGVLGALASRAEAAFASLDQSHQALARQLFLRLVTVRSAGEATRRRARIVELNALGDPGEVGATLATFGDARLLVFDRDPISRSPTAEVAHEALLTSWPRLVGWLDEAGEDLLLHGRLRDGVAEWEDRDREDGYLLTGGRLAQFDAWADSTDLTLAPSEIDFLSASREEADRVRVRRRRRRNLITAGFGAAAVVTGVFAFNATRNAEIAASREMAASAINVLDEDPELSVLLALEAAGIADPPLESVSAIHESLAAHHKILTYQLPTNLEALEPFAKLSPDGHLLATSGGGNYIEVVEVDSGERLWSREFAEGAIVGTAFSSDGSGLVATVGWFGPDNSSIDPALNGDLGVHRFDARTGAPIDYLPIEPCGLGYEGLDVVGPGAGSHLLADISSDSDCTYVDSLAGSMSFLDLATGEIEVLADEDRSVLSTPDGSRLFIEGRDSAEEPVSRVVDRPSGDEVAVLPGSPYGISADGAVVLTDSTEGIATWDVSVGQPEEPLAKMDFSLSSWLSSDGTTVARLNGPTVDLIDSRTGEVERVLRTGLGSNGDVSVSDDELRYAVNGDEKTVVFAHGGEFGPAVKLCDQIDLQSGFVDVAGGTASVFAQCPSEAGPQYLLDAETLEMRAIVADQSGRRSALSPDGRLVASQSGRVVTNGNKTNLADQIVLWDAMSGEMVRPMVGLCRPGPDCVAFPDIPFPDWPWDLVFSPDGSMLAMSGQNTPAVVVWDTSTGEIIATPTVSREIDPKSVLSAAFSPNGDRLVASLGSELWMFSTEDWSEVGQYLAPATGEVPVDNLTFTPDGETLIGTGLARFGPGHIVLMDGTTLDYLDQITSAHQGGVNDLALNQDGSLLASAGVDGLVRVWDVATRSLVHQIPVSPTGDVGGVDFVGDTGHLLVTALETGELRKVTSDTEELLGIARSRVTRGFTRTECSTYRIDPCPTLEEIRQG